MPVKSVFCKETGVLYATPEGRCRYGEREELEKEVQGRGQLAVNSGVLNFVFVGTGAILFVFKCEVIEKTPEVVEGTASSI